MSVCVVRVLNLVSDSQGYYCMDSFADRIYGRERRKSCAHVVLFVLVLDACFKYTARRDQDITLGTVELIIWHISSDAFMRHHYV